MFSFYGLHGHRTDVDNLPVYFSILRSRVQTKITSGSWHQLLFSDKIIGGHRGDLGGLSPQIFPNILLDSYKILCHK